MKTQEVDPKNLSGKLLAEIIGLTRQRVSQLRSEGVLQTNGTRGRYNLYKAVPAYIAHLQRHAGASAQTRLIIARTRKLEIENDKAEARLITREDAARVLAASYECITHFSKDLPKTLAPKLATARTQFEVRRIIDKGFGEVRAKIVAELAAVCGIDPDEDQKKILAGLRRTG